MKPNPGGKCIVCGSKLLLQIWRGHPANQKVHCNNCGTEVALWLHREPRKISARSRGVEKEKV